MNVHIQGIYRSKGNIINEKTGELRDYDNINIVALEPLVNSDWTSQDGTKGSREGFGKIPVKDLKVPYQRFCVVFGIDEFNDLMEFVDKDCRIEFGRKDRIESVTLR